LNFKIFFREMATRSISPDTVLGYKNNHIIICLKSLSWFPSELTIVVNHLPVKSLPSLQIGQHTSRYPIIQGGMGVRISGANLAAAVANAGGIGIISSVGMGLSSPYFDPHQKPGPKRREAFFEANRLALIDALRTARQLSPTGVIGVNSMVAAWDHEITVRTAAAHGANVIIAGAGLPLRLPEYVQDYPDVALVPIVSSVRAARVICRKWEKQAGGRLPDAFVVESPRTAGGHLGAKVDEVDDLALDATRVVPDLVAYVHQELGSDIPVIAAGGIWDRADIDQMLALGASGVQLGTRFITTHECDAHRNYKEFHLQAKSEDVVLVPSPVGMPGRALRNPFAEQAIANSLQETIDCVGCLQACKFRERGETYCILRALDRAANGDVEHGLIFSGSNAGKVRQLRYVAEVMAELVRGG
jgi:nitronate monooxygenase